VDSREPAGRPNRGEFVFRFVDLVCKVAHRLKVSRTASAGFESRPLRKDDARESGPLRRTCPNSQVLGPSGLRACGLPQSRARARRVKLS
jgi:hypothetical protein